MAKILSIHDWPLMCKYIQQSNSHSLNANVPHCYIWHHCKLYSYVSLLPPLFFTSFQATVHRICSGPSCRFWRKRYGEWVVCWFPWVKTTLAWSWRWMHLHRAEVKNSWSFASIPAQAFRTWYVIKQRDNFTFYLMRRDHLMMRPLSTYNPELKMEAMTASPLTGCRSNRLIHQRILTAQCVAVAFGPFHSAPRSLGRVKSPVPKP
jgi:hypothetical protein